MTVPENPVEFYTTPSVLCAFIIGGFIIAICIYLVVSPKLRPVFKKLFRVYRVIVLAPVYAAAGIIFACTLGKVNIFQKWKEIGFLEQWNQTHLNPTETFEDYRLHPEKYHVWPAAFICIVLSYFAQFFIQFAAEKFYNGQITIIFGLLSSQSPAIENFWLRWIWVSSFGILVWIPTKFFLDLVANRISGYNFEGDEPSNRPWYDKVRLIYIGWGYVIAADVIWSIGLFISILFPTWEGMFFAWVFAIVCGLIEAFLQFYNIRGLYKLNSWFKTIFVWLISMIPAAITIFLLEDALPRALF